MLALLVWYRFFQIDRKFLGLVEDDKKEALQVCEMEEAGDDFR